MEKSNQFCGHSCLVLGGAYNGDKWFRLMQGRLWRPEEQLSEGIRSKGGICARTGERQADIVLSHTCPIRYEPWEVFLPRVDKSSADKFTEGCWDRANSNCIINVGLRPLSYTEEN